MSLPAPLPPPRPVPLRYDPVKDVPQTKAWAVGGFVWWSKGYLKKHFHGVRIALSGPPPELDDEPAIFYCNHPSWWDPLVGLVLAYELYPRRGHFAPFDATALARYAFFEKLGFFAVEPASARGAAQFLRKGAAIMARPGGTLWVTAAGRFHDVRERPVKLRSGVAHLARRTCRGKIVPVAFDYPYWDERLPEALVRFGTPLEAGEDLARDDAAWQTLLETRLTETMDALTVDALARDPSRFRTPLVGRTAIGGMYDWFRSLRARFRGETFRAEHSAPPPSAGG